MYEEPDTIINRLKAEYIREYPVRMLKDTTLAKDIAGYMADEMECGDGLAMLHALVSGNESTALIYLRAMLKSAIVNKADIEATKDGLEIIAEQEQRELDKHRRQEGLHFV